MPNTKTKNEHALNLFISWELKDSLQQMANKADRTVADIVRMALKLGIPLLNGVCESEEIVFKEQIEVFRELRGLKQIVYSMVYRVEVWNNKDDLAG